MLKALIVEDNPQMRQTIMDALSSEVPFVRLCQAADGEEALKLLAACVPDIIFMDIKLPGENGLNLTKKITARFPQVVVAIVTSYDQPEYREVAFQNGAKYFFSKYSICLKDITNVVKDTVSHRKKE